MPKRHDCPVVHHARVIDDEGKEQDRWIDVDTCTDYVSLEPEISERGPLPQALIRMPSGKWALIEWRRDDIMFPGGTAKLLDDTEAAFMCLHEDVPLPDALREAATAYEVR